jgi:hypothetical protein
MCIRIRRIKKYNLQNSYILILTIRYVVDHGCAVSIVKFYKIRGIIVYRMRLFTT